MAENIGAMILGILLWRGTGQEGFILFPLVVRSFGLIGSLVGVLTALLCLHLERRQEMGVLRALGARLRTVGGLMVVEATIITGLAGAVSLPIGLGLAWILVHIVNTRSFGWSFPMAVEFSGLTGVLGLAVVAGLLAAVVPWLMVRRAKVARLLEPRR